MEQRTAVIGSEGRYGSVAPGGPSLTTAIPDASFATLPATACTPTNWSAIAPQNVRHLGGVSMPKHGTRRLRSLST
jgi:hypothetical protein